MTHESHERRRQARCVKDVGMHCSQLPTAAEQVVTLRNFSRRGLYFESARRLQPGSVIVLRALDVQGPSVTASPADAPTFTLRRADPEACLSFRSHTVATVRRCERLSGSEDIPRFGVGAEVQILTD
jgi:hypothetical protein